MTAAFSRVISVRALCILVPSLFVPVLSCAASPVLTIAVAGVTNTQAILTYTAPNAEACSVQVSTNSNFVPLAYDVDPTKFTGANLDSRADIGSRLTRVFVIGARVAQRASDQNFYSRALQQGTLYYYAVTCPGGASGSGQFTTATLAFGDSYADPLPVDPTNPGEYAWPTLSLTDRTQQIVDPQTGVLLRRMSLPEDRNLPTTKAAFGNVRTTAWANGSAALSNTDGKASATITGSSAPLLLLPQNNVTFYGYINDFSGTHGNNNAFLNWFQVTLNAATSNTGCATNPTANCNIQVCLTIDGVNCNPNGKTFSQALTPTLTNYTFGTSGTAIDLWQNAGQRPFNGTEIAIRQGSVHCTGSSTVTWAGGDYFATFWTAGSVITINGINYPIQQVINTENLQLSGTCPSTDGQSVAYTGMNFGVIVRKQTTSPDTVSIQYVSANYDNGVFPDFDYTGEYDLCSVSTVVGPTGNAGYNCSMLQNGQVFWVDGTTAEAQLIALNQGNFGSIYTSSCGSFDSIVFDASDPDTWYCGGAYPQRMQYFGSHSAPANTLFPGYLQEQVNLPTCNSPSSPTNEPCVIITGLTGTTPIGTLIAAFDPTFDTAAFSQPYLSHVENGLLVIRCWRGNYGSIGWTVLFDPKATSNSEPNNAGCVGGGRPGCVVGAVKSWTAPAARWCALKSNDPMYVNGWSALGGYGWGALGSGEVGMGPYLSTVNDGTAFSTTLKAPGGPTTCPANSLGVKGTQCTTVRVDGQPYNPYPCVTSPQDCGGEIESGAPGAIGNAAVGDFFQLNDNGTETMRLIAIGGTNNTEWTFQRGYNNVISSSSANPQLITQCNANPLPANVNGGSEWYWNYAADPHGLDVNGATTIDDPNGLEAHFYIENQSMVNSYTLDKACGPPSAVCYQDRPFQSIPQLVSEGPTTVQTTNPAFNGVIPVSFGNWTQSHPAGPGWSASGQSTAYFYDGRPFNGGPLSGSATSNGSNPATLVTGTLWKFTAAQVPQLHRKINATFAFSGSKALLDVSSPQQGAVITGTAADQYQYCVADVAGECISGSAAGDVYINAPYVEYPFCNFPSQASNMADEYDLCIGDNGMIYNSLTQMNNTVVDPAGTNERMLSKGLSRARITTAFWHPHALADSKWLYFKDDYAQDIGDMILLLQVPSGVPDSVNRQQFEPLNVSSPTVLSGTATAFVEFGYGENGAPVRMNCTTRNEACATASPAGTAINLDAPFYFEKTEASRLKPIACTQSCSVVIPVLPQHVVYVRWVFLNPAGAVIGRSATYPVAMN
jgi:hypothetical protein